MSQLSLATKLAIISSLTADNVAFLVDNASGSNPLQTRLAPTITNAGLASQVFISGYGQFPLDSFRYIRAIKPVNGVNQVLSVDPAVAEQITVAAGLVKGAEIVFKLKIQTTDARSEFASDDTRDTRYQPPFTYVCVGNDTAAQVVAGLYKQISQIKNLFPEADGAGEPYTATLTGGVLSVTAKDSHLTLRLYVDNLFAENAAQVPVFAPVTTTAGFEGRGTFVQMRSIIHETEGSNELDSHSKRVNLPQFGTLYTQLHFGTRTGRPDLSGNGAASQEIFQTPDFSLYVPDTAGNDSVLDALLTFFGRISGTKEFVQGDVAGTTTTTPTAVIAAPQVAYDPNSEDLTS